MNIQLLIHGLIKYISGALVIFVLLFLPAGSFSYWNGWLFMGLLFIPMFFAGMIMFIKNPSLLKSRLDAKEKEKEQKLVVFLSGMMFLIGFLLCGFNYRLEWFVIPKPFVYFFSFVFLLSYLLYFEVLRENTYLSRTIEVKENQKVIDTGLYGIVRHPMYLSTIFLFLSIPLILGCLISFFIFCLYPILIVIRIQNEEKVLEKKLKGYKEYQRKVKYRLIPFIW